MRALVSALIPTILIMPAALADVSGTVTLQSGGILNLDTGTTATSGGDLLWNGSSLIPQGSAATALIGASSLFVFNGEMQSQISNFKLLASSTPIPAAKLPVNELFAAFTNGGNVAKVLVTANGGGSITLQFLTFIAPPPLAGPVITQVMNENILVTAGYPNSGIAPSSIFVIRGTGLADAGDPVLQSSADPGVPLKLNGSSITVTVNGVTTHPPIYYTSPTQIAAILPAATPVGTGTITVTHNDMTSATAPIQVVSSAIGLNTYNVNTAVATDATTGSLIGFTNSATPNETLVLWATGLGASPADSDSVYTLTPHAINTPLKVFIGGVSAPIIYQGASAYPGVDLIIVTVPQSAPQGCWVTIAAATSVISNIASIPINSDGGACVDAPTGLTGTQIQPSGGQTIRGGLVALVQTNTISSAGVRTTTNSTDAAFEKYTGVYTPSKSVSPGGCIVGPIVAVPTPGVTGLDVGTVSLTGPNGLNVTLASQLGIKGAFYSDLSANAIPSTGGTYTFKGTGGADVGPFTVMLTLSNPLIVWTNQVTGTIDRSQDLKVEWAGGNPGSYVFINGTSTVPGTQTSTGFTCLTKADDKQFTVPSYILQGMVAGSGGIQLQNDIYGTISPSGIDIGVATADIEYGGGAITFK